MPAEGMAPEESRRVGALGAELATHHRVEGGVGKALDGEVAAVGADAPLEAAAAEWRGQLAGARREDRHAALHVGISPEAWGVDVQLARHAARPRVARGGHAGEAPAAPVEPHGREAVALGEIAVGTEPSLAVLSRVGDAAGGPVSRRTIA